MLRWSSPRRGTPDSGRRFGRLSSTVFSGRCRLVVLDVPVDPLQGAVGERELVGVTDSDLTVDPATTPSGGLEGLHPTFQGRL